MVHLQHHNTMFGTAGEYVLLLSCLQNRCCTSNHLQKYSTKKAMMKLTKFWNTFCHFQGTTDMLLKDMHVTTLL